MPERGDRDPLQRDVPVRAFVHRIDERSESLRTLGAEIFEGDFLDAGSVVRAADGASAIYFAYPVQDGLLDATAAMALAALPSETTQTLTSGIWGRLREVVSRTDAWASSSTCIIRWRG